MEIVEFSEALQTSTSGPLLGDEILAAVVRSAIIAAALVSTDVRADASAIPGPCARWLGQPGNQDFVVGLSDEDAVAFTELFFGAPPRREARGLSPVERRVLGTHLAVFLAPIAGAVDHAISPEKALVDVAEPPSTADWLRFGVSYTLDDVSLTCVIAARSRTPAAAGRNDAPSIEDIPVEAEVALRGIPMAWGDLAALRVGDVLSCAIAEDTPIEAWIGNRVAFSGRVIAIGDELVYEIQTTYMERSA